jgi:hypothetical protein
MIGAYVPIRAAVSVPRLIHGGVEADRPRIPGHGVTRMARASGPRDPARRKAAPLPLGALQSPADRGLHVLPGEEPARPDR